MECGGFFMGRWCTVTDFTMCVLFRCSFFFELVFVLVVDRSKGWSFNTWAGTEFNTDLFSIVQAAPIIMFAFTCQVNVFSIYDELEKPVSICQHHLWNCLVVQGNGWNVVVVGTNTSVLICNFSSSLLCYPLQPSNIATVKPENVKSNQLCNFGLFFSLLVYGCVWVFSLRQWYKGKCIAKLFSNQRPDGRA